MARLSPVLCTHNCCHCRYLRHLHFQCLRLYLHSHTCQNLTTHQFCPYELHVFHTILLKYFHQSKTNTLCDIKATTKTDGRWCKARYCCRKSSVRPSVRLSIRPSVCNVDVPCRSWISPKVITRVSSLGSSLLEAPIPAI